MAKAFGKPADRPADATDRGGARREVKLARIARGRYTYLHEDGSSTLKSVLLAARTTARMYPPRETQYTQVESSWPAESGRGSRWKVKGYTLT